MDCKDKPRQSSYELPGLISLSPVLRYRLPFVSRLWVFTLKYDIVWIAINRDFFVLYLSA